MKKKLFKKKRLENTEKAFEEKSSLKTEERKNKREFITFFKRKEIAAVAVCVVITAVMIFVIMTGNKSIESSKTVREEVYSIEKSDNKKTEKTAAKITNSERNTQESTLTGTTESTRNTDNIVLSGSTENTETTVNKTPTPSAGNTNGSVPVASAGNTNGSVPVASADNNNETDVINTPTPTIVLPPQECIDKIKVLYDEEPYIIKATVKSFYTSNRGETAYPENPPLAPPYYFYYDYITVSLDEILKDEFGKNEEKGTELIIKHFIYGNEKQYNLPNSVISNREEGRYNVGEEVVVFYYKFPTSTTSYEQVYLEEKVTFEEFDRIKKAGYLD